VTQLVCSLKRMNGYVENSIAAGDDIGAGQMGGDVGLDANADALATIGETVVLGTHASGGAAGQLEPEWLADRPHISSRSRRVPRHTFPSSICVSCPAISPMCGP
jgi:hypothetical protein